MTMSKPTSTPCEECHGDGMCNGCGGDGRTLAQFVSWVCPTCKGYGQVTRDGRLTWCSECGSSGRLISYGPVLEECQDCIGDGACAICQGTGVYRDE
jgi:DnaJ-class molecular chaperone